MSFKISEDTLKNLYNFKSRCVEAVFFNFSAIYNIRSRDVKEFFRFLLLKIDLNINITNIFSFLIIFQYDMNCKYLVCLN